MANLSASFLQRKNQILGGKANTTLPKVSTTSSKLPASFIQRKQQILTPPKPVATTQPIAPLKTSALNLPTTPISGNIGVGSNNIAYPKEATATPEQNRVAMKAIDIVKNTRNAINDGIATAGTPLKIFFPTPVYAPEDYEDAKKLASEYEKSANLKVNKVANQFSAGLYSGVSGGIIKPNVGEAKTTPEKIASGTGTLLGTYYTMAQMGSFADKVLFPGKTIETALKLSPTVAKYVVPIVKNVAVFDIYGQLDPDTQDRAKKLFMDTVTAIPFTLLGNIQKGIYKVPATFALGYSMAKAAGASNEDALINASLLALLTATEALTSPRTKNLNTKQLTPEEIRMEVYKQNKQNTQQGKDLLEIANHAEQTGSKAELKVDQVKSSILEDILGKKTSITQLKVDYVKNPDTIGGKENVSAPATPETQTTPKEIIPPTVPQQAPVVPPKEIVTPPKPLETTKPAKVEPIVEEKVVKKQTAESLIKEKGYDLDSVDITDNENFIVEDTAGNKAKLIEIPLSEFGNPKFETAANYKGGENTVTSPIEVSVVDGKYKITDGANRFSQAVANGDKTILAVVENYEQYKPTKEKAQKIDKQEVEKVKLEDVETILTVNSDGNLNKGNETVLTEKIKTSDNALILKEELIDQLFKINQEIKNVGGKENASTNQLLQLSNIKKSIKALEILIEQLPSEKNKPKTPKKKKVTSPKAVEQTKKKSVVLEEPVKQAQTKTKALFTDKLSKLNDEVVNVDENEVDDAKVDRIEKEVNAIGKKLGFQVEFDDMWGGYVVSLTNEKENIKAAGKKLFELTKSFDIDIELNKDGTIRLYHGTTKKVANSMIKNGIDRDIYLSPSQDVEVGGVNGAAYYGDTIIAVDADPRLLSFNPAGEFTSNGGLKNIKIISTPEVKTGEVSTPEVKITKSKQKLEKKEKTVTTGGKSAAEQENLPYADRTYYRGLQGKAMEEYLKTGILPKAQQAFGGDYSMTSDYETAKDYAGESGIVVELKIDKDTGVSEADPFDKQSLEDNWNDIQDVGEGEMIVNDPSKVKVINRPEVSQAQKPKEVTLAPSQATNEDAAMEEAAKAGTLNGINLTNKKYNKPIIGVPQIKIFISNPEFQANPVMTYENDVLSFKGKKLEFSVYPQALNINAERLTPGDKIRIDIDAFKKSKGVQQTRVYKNDKVFASTGAFADIKNLTEKFETKSTPEMRIVEMPEMVRLATQLMEGVPAIKRSRARKNIGVPNGLFRGRGKGEIYLNPDIFKTPGQAAKTLAHEMGHLADYLPDYTMARGNLIGRIATLNKFLRSTFSGHLTEQRVDELIRQRNDLREQRRELKDEDGVVSDVAIDNRILTELKKINTEIKTLRSGESISDPKIRKELRRLSRRWKPFNPKQNAEFTKYRYSPPELYADALSVLFNDPALLETKAPKFYKSFFKYLDQKPEYKKELLDLQTLLLAGDDQVMNLRLTEIGKNYKEGNAAWMAKDAEKRNNKFNIIGELNTNFIGKGYNLNKKVGEAVKQGKSIDPEINPIYTEGGLNYLDGEVKNIIVDSYQRVHSYTSEIPQISITTDISGKTETLSLNGWESLGMITQLERSMYERGELANPGGYDPKTAKETLAALKTKYEVKDWKKLQKAKRIFRRGTMAINKMALDHGFRTPELSTELMANKTYATFQVLDYIDTYISPAIYKQTGTLKAVANPATATVVKAIATVRAILYNDAKNANLDFLIEVDPENITPSKTRFNGKYKEPIASRDPDKVLTTSIRDGKVTGVYIDKDLDLIFNHTTETTLRSLGKLSKLLTGAGLYRPVFTSINLGFQLFNFQKDFIRTWRNMPDRTLGDIVLSLPKLIKDYATSAPTAWRAATGKPDDLIKEMENANIIGLTRNDVYGSPDTIGEEYISKVLQDLGAMPELKQSTIRTIPGIKYIPKLFDAVSLFGNFIERLPKVAGYKRLRGKVVTGEFSKPELAHYVRNYIGSPDFLSVGRVTPVTNNLFLFSNAAKEGIRGDINMAFRPKTKGGWWFKTLLGTVLPKLLQLAASLGLLGLLYKKMLDGVSEYDKTNYTIIPLGLDKNGKTIYIRLPNDESGRFMGAMVWKIGNIFDKEKHQDLVSSLMDVFSLYSGQLPSMTPSITGGSALLTYLSGRNPYDNFRNRLIIPDTTFKAGFKYSFPVMLEWLKNNQGLTIVMPSYTPDGEMTNLEKILNLPVLSNVIGRFVKVSDYGKIEKASQIQKEVSKEASIKTLEKREKTNTALEKYLAGEKTDENYKDIAGQLVKDVLGHNPDMNNKEEVSQAKAIEKQFRFAVIAGSNPPEISNVVDATTNQAKAENLKILQETVPTEKFAELLKMFVEEGVVTVDTLIKYGEIMSQEQSAVPEKKKTALSLVKPAYAIEDKTITPTPAGKRTTYAMTNADGEQISVTPRNNKITEKVLRDNQELVDIIIKAASDFDIDPGLMLDMAYSESTFRANPPLNDNSPTQVVKGLFQWKESSWEMAKKALNDQIGDDRTDAKDNAIATAWALSTGKIRWWEANGNHLKWSKNYTTKELKKYGWRL